MTCDSPPPPRLPRKPLAGVARTLRTALPPLPPHGVLAAVSGGADSTALALSLAATGHLGAIAHLDHSLRGADSAADAAFVAALADELHVPFLGEKLDVRAARHPRESLEMAARRLRRDFLQRAARQASLAFVATGHTADDQAETVLLRILRGTSPEGLAGMAYVSDLGNGLHLVRPLLDTWRTDLEAWLRHLGRTWRTDATNDDLFALRNRIRHAVLPMLKKEINPRAPQALLRLADIARHAATPLGQARRAAAQTLATAHNRPDYATVVRLASASESLSRPRPRPSPLWHDPDGTCTPLPIPTDGSSILASSPIWTGRDLRIVVAPATGWTPNDGTLYLSLAACAGQTLALRHPRPGDRLLLPRLGHKKLSDLLTDLKIPLSLRPALLVVTLDDQPAALPPLRVAAPWLVPAPDAPSLRLSCESAQLLQCVQTARIWAFHGSGKESRMERVGSKRKG